MCLNAQHIEQSDNARGLNSAGLAINADISQSDSTAGDRRTDATSQKGRVSKRRTFLKNRISAYFNFSYSSCRAWLTCARDMLLRMNIRRAIRKDTVRCQKPWKSETRVVGYIQCCICLYRINSSVKQTMVRSVLKESSFRGTRAPFEFREIKLCSVWHGRGRS